jgi:hypothetical protein
MSYNSFFGAFPIASVEGSLDPTPDERVGELQASSRNAVFGRVVRDLLDALPEHDSLRFLAGEHCGFRQRSTDAQTIFTLFDSQSLPLVIAALDGFLAACHERAAAVASAVCFGTDHLTVTQIREVLAGAGECSDVNAGVPNGADGDTAEFVFCALVSLRGLLRRALASSRDVAVFTWVPE